MSIFTRDGRVRNAPLREAFRRSGLSYAEVARHAGWTRRRRAGVMRPDEAKVRHRLGIKANRPGTPARVARGRVRATSAHPTHTCSYEDAVAIVNALGVDPVDFGL